MSLPIRLLAVALCGLLSEGAFHPVAAQGLGSLQSEVSVFGVAGTGDRLPFWLSANEYGTVDRGSANLGTRLSVERPYGEGERFDYAFGADLLARASEHSTLHAHELYGQVKYGPFQLTAGWKRRTSGLVDSTLSIGSMMTSKNAAPLPRVSVSTPDFVSVPGTQGYLSFKGYFAHGWFTDDRVVENPYLHSKYLYLRVFPGRFPVQLYGGLVHNATWAGTHPEFGDLADELDDYWLIVTNQSSDDPDAEPSAAGEALGSSIAIYDFSASVDALGGQVRAYRQFFVETSAGAQFRNVWDGLWGLSLDWAGEPQIVEGLLWEHLYTKRQSAQAHRGDPPFGADVYYSNGVYRSGWAFRGRTIGTPLMFSDGEYPGVDNNIVVAHHLGLKGTLAGTAYRLFGTWSRNYGSRRVCVQQDCLGPGSTERQVYESPLTQWSFLAEASRPVSAGLVLRAAISYDTGELYEERVGLRLGLTWQMRNR